MVRPIPTGFILISAAAFFTTMLLLPSPVDGTSGSHELGLYFPAATVSTGASVRGSCPGGSIEECMMMNEEGEEEDEGELAEMDSESDRRILFWRRRYISYGALFRDRVPCSRRGYSYYNCRPGARVNPYRRGCSAITRCRTY